MQTLRNAVIAVVIVASSACWAQNSYPRPITLNWTLPTLYEDGQTIQPGDLADTRITCERHNGDLAFDILVPVGATLPGEAQSHTEPAGIPLSGTYTCLAYAITIDGVSSEASAPAVKKFTGKPNPPTNLNAIVN